MDRGGLALVLVLVGGLSSKASTDDPSSMRDADACQADIHKLCDQFFPDEKLIATCLVDKRANLSQACAEILARPPSDRDQED